MMYPLIAVCTLAVAYSMAEMCSAFPVNGDQFLVALVAPLGVARGLSWVTGWIMITGIVPMAAISNLVAANFILGMVNLNHPDEMAYCPGLVLGGNFCNIFVPRL